MPNKFNLNVISVIFALILGLAVGLMFGSDTKEDGWIIEGNEFVGESWIEWDTVVYSDWGDTFSHTTPKKPKVVLYCDWAP